MIRLLAIDIDGTLLTKERQIHPSVFESVQRAKAAGIQVILASGRIRPSMLKFAEPLDLHKGPMVCGNGTHVVLSDSEELLYRPIAPLAQAHLLEYAEANGLHVNLYTRDKLFFAYDTPWGDVYRTRVDTVVPETLNGTDASFECLKVMLVDHPENISRHLSELEPIVASWGARATESEPEYLEFMDASATKGSALQQLATRIGIAQEETAAIGDYLNDLEMLEWAGLSGAVGNAHPRIKQAAKHVLSSNEQGGVSEFIERFVLKHSA